jgi:hypothetical protein
MPHLNHMRASCSYGCSEEELRKLLANEKGTARRQELFKAIWRLSQPRGEGNSNVQAKDAADGPDLDVSRRRKKVRTIQSHVDQSQYAAIVDLSCSES